MGTGSGVWGSMGLGAGRGLGVGGEGGSEFLGEQSACIFHDVLSDRVAEKHSFPLFRLETCQRALHAMVWQVL